MKTHEISLMLADIAMVEQIEYALLECEEDLSEEEIGVRYWRIGDILLANARIHDLDEDLMNLLCLSRCVACALLCEPMRTRHFHGKCWEFKPPYTRHHGNNDSSSDVRPVETQKVAMVMNLLHFLRYDPVFVPGIKVLQAYHLRHDLWTAADVTCHE
ncbi:hypothetical protein [Massilia scottii]|uniref:hypothetical protein n=1 Tax=Massilia scottii TaxID=3057166 RepID=UPI002796A6F6|nr:hypothetical protein [Massilia sp. CCM 9029]MDQ1834581.1 hypothetical protein [Massilia sp. CCM 9029]